jgi:CTP synthase (UTP-ammonia lyase)
MFSLSLVILNCDCSVNEYYGTRKIYQRSTKHYTINNKQQEHLNKKIKTTEGENTRRKKNEKKEGNTDLMIIKL